MFKTNQAKLFKRLEKENGSNDISPGSLESAADQPVTHNNEVKWLRRYRDN